MNELEGWRKSSYSGNVNQSCVEVAPVWRKSSYSGGAHQDCVEVAPLPSHVGVRDTKYRENGHFLVPVRQWHAFIRSVRTEAF